jgi:hypothetical protein
MTFLLSEIEMYCRYERTKADGAINTHESGRVYNLGRWGAMNDVLNFIKEGKK